MKQTRLVLALVVTSLAATPALAASLTMLQFGSFETRDEAQKRLTDITAKYGDTLGTLPTTIREVKLPPDNLTVYRTQAGPVANRAAAQSICSKLASTGDECYIVQTAMVNATAPSAVASVLPAATPTTDLASTTMPDLTSKLSTLQSNTDTTLTDAPQPMLNSTAVADPSPDMKAALDKAVADQSAVTTDVNTTTSAAAPQSSHTGFWSHLNPFSPSTPKPVAVKAPELTAAPIEPVMSEPLAAPTIVAAPVAIPAPTPMAVATPVVVTPIAVAAANPPSVGFDATPVVTQAPVMQLPPPPAPLKAQDRTTLTSAKAPLSAPEVTAAPITPMAPMPSAAGTVQVEEAKRVPVTSATAMPMPAVAMATPFVQPPVSLLPNSTQGMKTLWAQIGPFASNDDALAYWANYRQNHPDFPVVRVRVTSSYQQLIHGENSYALRVGPIAQRAFVSNLCASLQQVPQGEAQPPAMRCGVVSDMGASSSLQPARGMMPTSRYAVHH